MKMSVNLFLKTKIGKFSIFGILVLVVAVVFIGSLSRGKPGSPSLSKSTEESSKRGVLLKKYRVTPETVDLGSYGALSIKEAWAEALWGRGLFESSTDDDYGPTLYNICIRLREGFEKNQEFIDSSDSLQVGVYPLIWYKRSIMYTMAPPDRPVADTVVIPIVKVDVTQHASGTVLDTIAIVTLVGE